MSNDLIVQLKSDLVAIGGGLDEDTRAVAGGSVGGNKRISIEGGVFRKISAGKEVGSIEDRHMNVIFVKMAHTASRTFYKEAYKKGVKISPACWSSDAKVPDADVKTPQAKSCSECPFSVKGSGSSGQGTACRLSWRTAVVLPNDPSGDVMQLVLPAASCFGQEDTGRWPFRPYVQILANNNISASRVITKMQFDTKSSAPKLLFSPVGAVPSEDVEAIKRQATSQAAINAVKLTVFQTDSAGEKAEAEEEVAAPAAPSEPSPKLREKKPEAAAQPELSDVLSKWTKK